ncbi:diguanylate cyclase [Thalassobaculum sp. OXR-137]|uniref:diguanylate cyclase n=1 Tax=Thalassobaculum sp. OXR-137 TaxID=3100173 RepID=UPI002AC8C78F|nr:diguanylate cyclase [Thalassobaculum sp. OXR-137]WPZ36114.1 diguanylate cyclase [Thalassobaculum sp. OXR-137]
MVIPDAASHRSRHEAIVNAIEKAVRGVDDRLQRFHRSAISKVRPDEDLLQLGSHGASEFGRWYEDRRQNPPLDQPAFETLVALHEALLNHLALLAERAWKSDKVPVEEYDALLEKVSAFHDHAQRLAKAFQAAISDIDPLTGAQTRQVMQRDLKREIVRVRRSGSPACIALADIDHFKAINDTFGHGVGDQVLASVSTALIDNLRPYDSVYRYGGEEFLLCLPDTGPEEARRVLDRVRARIAKEEFATEDGRTVALTVSFGVTLLNPRRPIPELVERADKALYTAKEQGRNRVEVWRAEKAAPDGGTP